VHHDERFGYSLLVPDGWQRLGLGGSEHGVFYAPDPADLLTGLAVDAERLAVPVRASDLAAVRSGLRAGLRRLPVARITACSAEAVGALLTLEARATFAQAGSRAQRWVRLLYGGSVQVRLVAQAASTEQFAYWEPMFFTAMRSVHFGHDW
jgi:hypothetical protein